MSAHRLTLNAGTADERILLDVTWGEGTTDEMCMGSVALVSQRPGE